MKAEDIEKTNKKVAEATRIMERLETINDTLSNLDDSTVVTIGANYGKTTFVQNDALNKELVKLMLNKEKTDLEKQLEAL